MSFAFTEKKSRNRLILRLLLLVSIVFILALTFDFIRDMTILFLFILINAAFAYLKRFMPYPLRKYTYGFELVLICTVASSIALGGKVGLFMGILLMVVNYLAEKRPSDYFIVSVTLYALIGNFAHFFSDFGIIYAGIMLAIGYNVFAFILSKFLGGRTEGLLLFNTINLVFNILLFSMYGEFLLGLFN